MKCPTCGGEMTLSETVCPRCHTPRPQWPPAFEETARRFADLKARFQAGQLDTANYEAVLHELMIEHEGAFWTLGAEMEVWYRHDGTQWVQDTPPTLAAGEQPTLVGVRTVEVPSVKKGGRLPVGLLVGAAALVILLALGALVAVLVVPPILVNRAIAQGNEALAAGNYAKAETAFAEALEKKPENAEANLGMGQALRRQGRYAKAEAAFVKALEGEPGNAEANLGMGDTLSAQEKYAESIPYYQKVLMADDDLANAHAGLAWAYYHTGEYEKAITGFTRLIALEPADVEGYKGKGLSYYALKRCEDALEPLKRWAEIEPNSFDAHRVLGLAEYRQGNADLALEYLNRAVDLGNGAEKSELASVYYGLGGAYCQQGKGQECTVAYEKAEELDPSGKNALTEEEQNCLNKAYVENAMQDMLLDLDFSKIVTQGDETYAIARTGQQIKIEGAVHLVDGPREGSSALMVENTPPGKGTNVSVPVVGSISAKAGTISVWLSLPFDSGETVITKPGIFRWWDSWDTESLYSTFNDDYTSIVFVARSGGAKQRNPIAKIFWRANTWHQVIFTWDAIAGQRALYIDGELQDIAPYTIPFISSDSLSLGRTSRGHEADCAFTRFTTFSRPLVFAEVAAFYAAEGDFE